MPLFRKERSYTFSTRADQGRSRRSTTSGSGVDVVRHELNHRQAEFGDYRRRARRLQLQRLHHRRARLHAAALERVRRLPARPAVLLRARTCRPRKMTGREWQSAFYIRDRWNVHAEAHGQRRACAPSTTR